MAGAMRPRFRRRLAVPPDEAFRRIRRGLAAEDCPFRARFAERQGHSELRIARQLRHFWSPTLGLEIRAAGSESSLIGLFGPHPAVWTFFMFVHFAAVTFAVLGLVLAWSQWSLGEPAWGLWSVPVAALASGGAWTASQVGQKLAHGEMEAMLAFLDANLPVSDRDGDDA